MKIQWNYIAILLLTVPIVFTSCMKDEAIEKDLTSQNPIASIDGITEEGAAEKAALFPKPEGINLSSRAPVNYKRVLCGYPITATHATSGSWLRFNKYDLADYYRFCGSAGDQISIYVPRISPDMDPIAVLRFGTITDGNQFTSLPFIGAADDNVDHPSCYGDPRITVTLPYTGEYTLGVWDYLSCGSTYTYRIVTTGINCMDYDSDRLADACDDDDDNDGCPDADDAYPFSSLDETVIITGCNSGVPNLLTNVCGEKFSDVLLGCAINARNHGDFVSCVSHATNEWKKAGWITGAQKGLIIDCAASSNIGK